MTASDRVYISSFKIDPIHLRGMFFGDLFKHYISSDLFQHFLLNHYMYKLLFITYFRKSNPFVGQQFSSLP